MIAVVILAVPVACGGEGPAGPQGGTPTSTDGTPTSADGTDRPVGLEAARLRAVAIETAGCGSADATRGSGLAIDDDLVLTAAHVVASGGSIEVLGPDGPRPAELVAYDPRRDLALVSPAVPLTGVPPAPIGGSLAKGEHGTIVAAATTGDVAATVAEVLIIETDDVRSPTRSTRRGYLTEAATAPGDSGAGFYDADGLLIGLLFAVSTADENRSWVTASSEIDAFLAEETGRDTFGCDADRSRITRMP